MSTRIAARTDPEVLALIGERLRSLREQRGLGIREVAQRADLSTTSVVRAEKGENTTLLTLVRLLRVYGRLEALASFIPVAEISPLEEAEARRRESDG